MAARRNIDRLLVTFMFCIFAVGAVGCAHTDDLGEDEADDTDVEAKADIGIRNGARASDSVNYISSEEIEERQVMNLEELLRGTAGVEVNRTSDGGFRIRIRGERSISGSNEPLYVVDGVPTQPMVGSGLVGLNPQDIKSIRVLKGSAAAIYGMRGANGVVVIETKDP